MNDQMQGSSNNDLRYLNEYFEKISQERLRKWRFNDKIPSPDVQDTVGIRNTMAEIERRGINAVPVYGKEF